MGKRLFFVLFFKMLIVQVQSQSIFNLNGKITDESLKPISRATAHLLNTTLYSVSNDSGIYSFPALQTGKYTIEISATGYASVSELINVITRGEHIDFKLQSITRQLESVTVTAEKRETILQQLPATVTSLSVVQVQEYRLWNVKEISGVVPGLYAGNSGDERNVTSIRGITTTSYDPAVATYVDGVNQFSLDTYIPQLNDVERIEVLRGPQGTLYGRNAMGGVINIITKQPGNNTSGFVELNFGNYNQQRYSASIKTPILKNKLYFGAAGLYDSRNGFYTNEFNNSSFDKQHGISGNYYLKWLPSASWSLTLNVKHQNNINYGAYPMVNGVAEAFANPYKLNQDAIGKMVDNTANVSLFIRHSGHAVDVTFQTAFQNNHRTYESPVDGDFSPLDAFTIINDYGKDWNNVKVITEELRFSSPASTSSKFNWTAGLYLFHQYNPVKQATHFGKDAGLLGVPATDFASINISEAKNSGAAVYGQVNYTVTDKWMLFGGLRYDYEQKKLAVTGEYQPDGSAAITVLPDTAAKENFSALSPKIGLQFQFTGNSNIYSSYTRGYRTGGLTQLSGDPSQPPLYPYKPEYSNNIEIGVKNMLFNNRLRVNAVVFLTYVDDAQVPTLILPDAITVTRNTGSLTSKGVELELSAKPAKGFQLDYNAGYTDAEYKSLKVASNGQTVDLDGKKQIFTPDITSMLALQYSYNISEKHQLQLTARAEWFYFGERYFDLANEIKQSPYSLYNTRAGISSKYISLFFWGRNLGDKKYMEYAYDFGAVHLAAPVTYGVTIRANL
jgi:iron complex outermembrane receptor protein